MKIRARIGTIVVSGVSAADVAVVLRVLPTIARLVRAGKDPAPRRRSQKR